VDRIRRAAVSRRSRAEVKAEVEAKSTAVQEAVMKALMSQSAPPPPPAPTSSSQDSSSTRYVAFNSATGGSDSDINTNAPKETASPGPRSVNAVQNALNDLNKLIEDRARERARKTIRAERRRGESAYAPAPISTDPDPVSALTAPRNVTPLEPNSTAASNIGNRPPWGCLKGGNLPTFREHMRTQRARRKHRNTASDSNAKSASIGTATPRVRIQTPQEAATLSAVTTPSTLADTVITVGRKDDGRVAFVVGGQGTRRTERVKHGQRSVTNRAKLRKSRLLKGGNKAPQRLVDVIAESVDIIGDVVRPHEDSFITLQG